VKTPDWDHWKRRVDVELWEAAFLSYNINPNLLDYRDIRNCGMGNDKVFERLRLLRDNLHLREFFSPCRIDIIEDYRNVVRLYEYARWCISNGTDIPDGLSNIAKGTNIYELQEIVKQNEGRYTLQEAADLIEQKTGEPTDEMMAGLISAVAGEELLVYLPGSKERYYHPVSSEYYEEAYWDDLNDWLKKEYRIVGVFPDPSAATTTVVHSGNKQAPLEDALRSDILYDPIALVIKNTGSMKIAKVYAGLKTLAKNKEFPFNGEVKNGKLYYESYKGELTSIDKIALNKRLDRLKIKIDKL